MISRWLLKQMTTDCMESIPFKAGEDKKSRAERVAKHIGVSRATLYNWAKEDSAQWPNLNQFVRMLYLAEPETAAACVGHVARVVGFDCRIQITVESPRTVQGKIF